VRQLAADSAPLAPSSVTNLLSNRPTHLPKDIFNCGQRTISPQVIIKCSQSSDGH